MPPRIVVTSQLMGDYRPMVRATDDGRDRRVDVLTKLARSAILSEYTPSRRTLPSRVEEYRFTCSRAIIEVQLDPGTPLHSQEGETKPGQCRVFWVKVHALAPESAGKTNRALGCFNLTVTPGSALGFDLGNLFQGHLLSNKETLPNGDAGRVNAAEGLLAAIGKAVSAAQPPQQWTLQTTGNSVAAENIKDLLRSPADFPMRRILPDPSSFMKDPTLPDKRYIARKTGQDGQPVILEACISKDGRYGAAELRTNNHTGGHQRLPLSSGAVDDAEAWITDTALRIAEASKGPLATEADGVQTAGGAKRNPALSSLFEVMMRFWEQGPESVRALVPSRESSTDRLISGGVPSVANWLRRDSPFGSRVQLDVGTGGWVARASVLANGTTNSAVVVWYLETNHPFWDYNHAELVRFWQAAELLTSPSDAAIQTGVRILNTMCEPGARAPQDIDAILQVDTSYFRALSFAGVTPIRPDDIVRSVEGIQSVEVCLTDTAAVARYPDSFCKMVLSVDNNGTLTVRAYNSFNAQVSAFFDQTALHQADGLGSVVHQLCDALQNISARSRVEFQTLIERIADSQDSWCVSVANQLASPNSPRDLPPQEAVAGNKAYDKASRIAVAFIRFFSVQPANIAISPVPAGSAKPDRCKVTLQIPHRPERLAFEVNAEGISAASVSFPSQRKHPTRVGPAGKKSSTVRVKFTQRPDRPRPFASDSDLLVVMRAFDDFNRDLRAHREQAAYPSTPHRKPLPRLLQLLSEKMRYLR